MPSSNYFSVSTFFIFSVVALQACAPTAELEKARRVVNHRASQYSPLSGVHYRLPPSDEPSQPAPMAMPELSALSSSPLFGGFPVVELQPGKQLSAKPRKTGQQSQRVASYSPLTGETIWIQSD